MLYFELYGEMAFWLTTLVSAALILLGFLILYAGKAYHKKKKADGTVDEHDDPGIPAVLKAVYLGFFIWVAAVTYLVASRGLPI